MAQERGEGDETVKRPFAGDPVDQPVEGLVAQERGEGDQLVKGIRRFGIVHDQPIQHLAAEEGSEQDQVLAGEPFIAGVFLHRALHLLLGQDRSQLLRLFEGHLGRFVAGDLRSDLRGAAVAQNVVDADAEELGEVGQLGDVRAAQPALPVADRLKADAHRIGQLHLRHALLLAQAGDVCAHQRHAEDLRRVGFVPIRMIVFHGDTS